MRNMAKNRWFRFTNDHSSCDTEYVINQHFYFIYLFSSPFLLCLWVWVYACTHMHSDMAASKQISFFFLSIRSASAVCSLIFLIISNILIFRSFRLDSTLGRLFLLWVFNQSWLMRTKQKVVSFILSPSILFKFI